MFEHLGPTPEHKIQKNNKNFKRYSSFFAVALLVFLVSWSIGQGPDTGASTSVPKVLTASVFADQTEKSLVVDSGGAILFDFVIETDLDKVQLGKIKIFVQGVYDLDFLNKIKLYYQGVQLGQLERVDSQGFIIFETNDLYLKQGRNKFNLQISDAADLKPGQAIEFSLQNPYDINLSYQEATFSPKGKFPISGGLVSLVEKGQIVAVDSFENDRFFVAANKPQVIASFSLSSLSEPADLKQLVINYSSFSEDDLEGKEFVLAVNKELLSQAQATQNQIVFDLSKNISINENNPIVLSVHALSLPLGQWQFDLSSLRATGFYTGTDLSFEDDFSLSKMQAIDSFPELESASVRTNQLSDGWNQLYTFSLKAKGDQSVDIYKLTWHIEKNGLNIQEAELWLDNQIYQADIIIEDDKIVAKSSWDRPWQIDASNHQINLMVKVDIEKTPATLAATLLADKKPLEGKEDFSGNIIWAVGDVFYNSHKLPYLPLAPSVLE